MTTLRYFLLISRVSSWLVGFLGRKNQKYAQSILKGKNS